jgi:hypothetical protein
MKDQSFEVIYTKWKEIIDLPPQKLGRFTPLYHVLVRPLKVMPWKIFLIVSFIFVGLLCVLLGSAIVNLVSLLQRGI